MIGEQIERFERLEKELRNFLATANATTSDELLVRIDREVSSCFDSIVNANLIDRTDIFLRLRFLVSKLRTFNSPGDLCNRSLRRIEQDLGMLEKEILKHRASEQAVRNAFRDSDAELIEMSFVSQATRHLSHADLFQLSARITPFNAENNVTGVLIYDDSTHQFFQVMECFRSEASALLGRINSCPYHSHVSMHSYSPIKLRSYPSWSLSLLTTGDLKEICPDVAVVSTWFEDQLAVEQSAKENIGHQWLVESLGKLVA